MKRCGALRSSRHQIRQRLDVLAMNFDELEPGGGMRGADRRMGGLDQRGFAHAARAPQQRVVGRQAAREALGILDQKIAHPVDALEQRHVDTVDAAHRARACGLPDARRRPRRRQNRAPRRGRRQPLQRAGDPLQDFGRRRRWTGSRLQRRRRRLLRRLCRRTLRRLGHALHRLRLPLSGAPELPASANGRHCAAAALQLGQRRL